jgi:NAD(P)-dependent dehydrogenase (short-subunit alcohol dehydrogenase family)
MAGVPGYIHSLTNLLGKTLIITGSTGIAAAAARLAVVEGARLLIATSDEVSGLELSMETGGRFGSVISRQPERPNRSWRTASPVLAGLTVYSTPQG